ncbi:unnamed protein product [Closterium sp. NIES-65]|nr:unnamed protein product [Closterium sp. NIES-65]
MLPPWSAPDPRPDSAPQPSTVQPVGWQRVKLSRRQRQRQNRQQAPGLPPSLLQTQQQQLPQAPLQPPSWSIPAPPSFHRKLYGGPSVPRPWEPVTPPAQPPPAVVPGEPPIRVKQCVMHVGTCMTLLSYVLDQLHVTLVQQEVQIKAMQPAEQAAMVAVAEELQHYLPLIGFVPGSRGAALTPGPGALARLADSAQEDPLDLAAAAASVLPWLDGRLCWILVE